MYTTQSDVYAFGILMWELICWSRPFATTPYQSIARTVRSGYIEPVPECHDDGSHCFCPAETRRLLDDCRALQPARRPSFAEVIRRLEALVLDDHGDDAGSSSGSAGAGGLARPLLADH